MGSMASYKNDPLLVHKSFILIPGTAANIIQEALGLFFSSMFALYINSANKKTTKNPKPNKTWYDQEPGKLFWDMLVLIETSFSILCSVTIKLEE